MLSKKSKKELKEVLGILAIHTMYSDTELEQIGLGVVKHVLITESKKLKSATK